jgi:uncharacterized protein YciI
MFIINLTYKVALEEVEAFLAEHIRFLDEQYALGHFLASGRKVPRTGGIILSALEDKAKVEAIIEKDPFWQHQLADYELIEFVPSKTATELDFLQRV